MKRILMVCVAVFAGCGGSSPKEKCEDFVDTVCDRAVECLDGAQGMHDDCVAGFNSVTSCSQVKSVGETYGSCMDSLDSLSCAALFPVEDGEQTLELPASCSGVLKLQLAPAIRAALGRMTTLD